jgi:hypothetical protein
MATRDELVVALAARYAACNRIGRRRILDEFVAVTGLHRKHAMRLLRVGGPGLAPNGGYAAAREALIVLWEASDRICGKRLRPLMPVLIEAMERHGHLQLVPEVRAHLLAMSAATIDRALRAVKDRAGGRKRRHAAPSAAIRRSVPVRTFDGRNDPPPGSVEADLVAHSGTTVIGSYVQTLTLTDIATGWTECAPLLVREQKLLIEVLSEMRARIPFALLGFDTDNNSVFMNETVKTYCDGTGLVFTRCRPHRKNDQAWGGTEKRSRGQARRGLPPLRGGRGCGGAGAAVCGVAAVRELLPALVQAGRKGPQRREGREVLPPAGDAVSAAAGEPWRTAGELFECLRAEQPGVFPDGQLRTLQRQWKDWRQEQAHKMMFGAEAVGHTVVKSALPSP